MRILRHKSHKNRATPDIKNFASKLRYVNNQSEKHTKEEVQMKTLMLVSVLVIGFAQSGCEFIGGAVVGAGATGAGYEYSAHRQMQQLEEDYKNRKISREEYEDRKKQIEAGSLIY